MRMTSQQIHDLLFQKVSFRPFTDGEPVPGHLAVTGHNGLKPQGWFCPRGNCWQSLKELLVCLYGGGAPGIWAGWGGGQECFLHPTDRPPTKTHPAPNAPVPRARNPAPDPLPSPPPVRARVVRSGQCLAHQGGQEPGKLWWWKCQPSPVGKREQAAQRLGVGRRAPSPALIAGRGEQKVELSSA